jgi:hypothetical protein
MQEWFAALTPELVWGLYSRGLGLVFLISYTSLAGQVVHTSGRTGGFPAWRRLAKIRRDFPAWRRWLHFPTLLWLNDSDAMLRLLTWVGWISAACLIYGGPCSPWALATCYLIYVSLDLMVGLIYPWDSLLFEASVLGLFLPATHMLPDLHAIAAPPPALAWANRLLLFRVLFGFGKQKFLGSTNKDLSYLKGFLIGQPLPSPLGWYGQKMPMPLLKGAVLFMFFVEVPAPILGLIPGIPSYITLACNVFLMIGIQATGNFGYFSLLTIVASIPLLDNVTPTQLDFGTLFAPGAPMFTNAFVIVHTLCACMSFPFNSWFGQCWHLWAIWYRLPRLAQLPFDFVRLMHPTRWLHPYGVFPPNTGPGIKTSLLIEVTWDNQTWHEVEYDFAFCNERSRPRYIAPHHPRGDQAVIYETFGLAPTGLSSTTMGPYDPYTFGTKPAAHVLAQRITDGNASDFIKGAALDAHKEPPVAVRITTVMLEPVSIAEHKATGNYWTRSYIGPHIPPRQHDPNLWEDFLPEPELWHFDNIYWRRRSKLKRLIDGSLAGREDPMQLVLAEADPNELGPDDVERFWNELVAQVVGENRHRFDTLPDVVPAAKARFDRKQFRAQQRLLGRFSLLLVAKLEPLYLGRMSKPLIPVKTYFHLWMLAAHIIGKGKDAYLAALKDPMSVVAEVPLMTAHTGMYYFSLFRLESMTLDVQKMRLLTVLSAPYDEAKKQALLAANRDEWTSAQRTLDSIAQTMSGYYCLATELTDQFKGARFDLGYPEMYPSFREMPSGEVIVGGYAKPPPGVPVPVAPSANSQAAAE